MSHRHREEYRLWVFENEAIRQALRAQERGIYMRLEATI
jgi:hypothetical protein